MLAKNGTQQSENFLSKGVLTFFILKNQCTVVLRADWYNTGRMNKCRAEFPKLRKCTTEGWPRAFRRASPYTWEAKAYNRVKSYQNKFCPLLGFWISSIACFGNVTLLQYTKWLHKYSAKENITSSFWIGTSSNMNTNTSANTNSKRNLHLFLQGCGLLPPVEHFPELVARLAFVQEYHDGDQKSSEIF